MTVELPLALDAVGKCLSGRPVLSRVGFSCPAGVITALLGPNGAGKTTTVTLATGLRRPDRGRVAVFGQPPTSSAARRRFSLVPQEIAFPAPVRVAHCLDFVAAQRPASPLAPSRDEICERLGLNTLLSRSAGGLSGGQQRKLAVALGFVRAPGLLVLDEATSNLDEVARATMWAMAHDYVGRGGAVLVTSHILADIESHADRVIVLSHGSVILERPLDEVRAALGGSTVSVRISDPLRAQVRSTIASADLGAEAPAPPGAAPGTVSWRTSTPVALVARIAELASDAQDLLVAPIPLRELLEQPAGPATDGHECGVLVEDGS